jgi:hypothetical protein
VRYCALFLRGHAREVIEITIYDIFTVLKRVDYKWIFTDGASGGKFKANKIELVSLATRY